MQHYILTTVQRDLFLYIKETFQQLFLSRCVDITPIKKGTDLWVIPAICFEDVNFLELTDALRTNNFIEDLELRELTQEELNFNIEE